MQKTFFHEQFLQTAEVDKEGFLIPSDEEIGKVEQTDFLDHILVGHEVGIVVHLAAFLGMPAQVPEILFAVAEVDESGRDTHCEDDQRRPRADGKQRDHKGEHTDDGTDDREVRVENMNGTVAGFALRVFEFFVEFGKVKACKVDFARLVHDFEVDVVDDKFAGNVVENVADAVDQSGDKIVGEPDDQDLHDEIEFKVSLRCGNIRGSEGIEKVCTDLCADDGGHAVEDRHEDHVKQDPRLGVPYETENIE